MGKGVSEKNGWWALNTSFNGRTRKFEENNAIYNSTLGGLVAIARVCRILKMPILLLKFGLT
jgi:hypothetical protein